MAVAADGRAKGSGVASGAASVGAAGGLGGLIEDGGAGERVKWIGEKTPGHTQFLGMLGQTCPSARVIHIVRDGRDCVVSGWLYAKNRKSETFLKRYPTLASYAAFAGDNWVRNVQAAHLFGRANPGRYLEVRYEDLHANGEEQVRRVLGFLDVDGSEAVVRECLGGGSFKRLTQGRQRGQEDRESHFRKGVVGDWREHFKDGCEKAFMASAGAILGELGYTD